MPPLPPAPAQPSGPEGLIEPHWRWLLLLIWLGACAMLVMQRWGGIHWLGLPDTDDNMRLQQVRDWLAGQAWFDLSQHRLDPPRGGDIHWSRLVDLPIAALILAAKLFVATPAAERFAVAVAPLLPLGVAMAALTVIVRRLVSPGAWWLAPAFLLSAQSTLGMMSPLRIDHHGWQLALLAVSLAGLLARDPARGGVVAGLAAALSLTIGAEMLLFLALIAACGVARWIATRAEAQRLLAYGATFAGVIALDFLLLVSPARKAMQFCDGLGPPIALGAIAAGGVAVAMGLAPLRQRWQRLAAAVVSAVALGLLVVLRAPVCLTSPEAAGGPELVRLWLSHVREVRPILRQSTLVAVSVLALPLAGLAGAGWRVWQARRQPDMLHIWLPMFAMTLTVTAFVFARTRFGPSAQLLAVPGMAALFWALLPGVRGSRLMLVRVLGTVALFLLVSGWGASWTTSALTDLHNAARPPKGDKRGHKQARDKAVRKADARCSTIPALRPLNRLQPATIMTFLDLGPRLITVTHHSAIAGPYHRNAAAILDLLHGWRGSPDGARRIAAAHHASYVLICPGTSESTIYSSEAPRGFYAQLAAGKAPAWLQPISLGKGSPFRLWRIL